jgi:hypothetical protein
LDGGRGKNYGDTEMGEKENVVGAMLFVFDFEAFYPPARAFIAGAVKSKAWSATSCLQILLFNR